MSQPSKHSINAAKRVLGPNPGTEIYTKQIDCPIHTGQEHTATLYQYPHPYAGIWECPMSGESDSCEHQDQRIETTQVDYWPTPDIDRSYDRPVYVCEDCEVTIPLDQADPWEDMAIGEDY